MIWGSIPGGAKEFFSGTSRLNLGPAKPPIQHVLSRSKVAGP